MYVYIEYLSIIFAGKIGSLQLVLEQGRARPTTQLSGGAVRAAAKEAWREGAANGLGAAHEDQRAASGRRHRAGPLYPRSGACVKQTDR